MSKFCCLIFAFALSTAIASAQATSLPDLKDAGALGQDLFLRSGSTGMVLVVVRNREVFFHGYGESAPGSGQPPTAESLLRLCSLSKIFTTDLLVKLASDPATAKTVRLETPLQRFAPPHARVPSRAKPITLGDLATHTSGLPRELGTAPRGTPHFTFPDYAARWRWLPAQHLRSVPGTAALYSNVAYDLLGDALQSAAHKPFPQLLAERTLTTLGMHETTFTPTPEWCAHLLLTAHDEGPCTSTENTAASSGLYSTASDMATWLKYLLGQTTPPQNPAAQAVYLDPAGLASEKGLDHAGTPAGIGLGWMHLFASTDPSHIVEKTGGGAGFLTYIAIQPAYHTAIFVAATDGSIETHLNVFHAANDLLLALDGRPPLPPEPPKPVRKARKPLHKRRKS